MSIQVGICGTGSFADHFIPLFKAHPEVDQVVLCDLDAKKLKDKAEKHDLPVTYPSLDELCQSDVDAIALFTQHHVHGPQAIQALKSGKHVYSAVPAAISLDEITTLVKTVEETAKIYMLGETSYYYPCAIYCRDRYRKGDFGHVVYAEAEYYHDFSHGLYDVYRWRHGKEWERYAGLPPLFYPTHSTSMIVSVTGAYATQVCGMGFVDRHTDNLFGRENNVWQNPFSNQTMLCKMSDGSVARINEFRRIGHPGTVGMSLYGTKASYEEQTGSQVWVTKDRRTCIDLGEELRSTGLGTSKVHPVHLLPKEYAKLPSGHKGSHQFLVNDFCLACASGEIPPNHIWQAARYLIPGLIAHESALVGSELIAVPDLGVPPVRSTRGGTA
jgi:predicted dehydrogenase